MKLTVDAEKFEVKLNKKVIDLAPKEFDILTSLMSANGNVLSRKALIKMIWNPARLSIDSRTIDQHVGRLRRKIGYNFILTVPTRGYRYIA